MKNLTERLNKHLQSIKEANGEITPKELLDLMKSRKSDIKKLHQLGKDIYITEPGENDSMIADAINNNNPSYDMFDNSYVGWDEYNFIAYCICSYLGVDSGIDINKAYKDIEKLIIEGEGRYRDKLEEDTRHERTMYDIIKRYETSSDKYYIEQAKKLRKEYAGIDLKEVIWVADDSGDELYNPIDFVLNAAKFAKICKANQLASKLQPLVKKAEKIISRIEI